MANDFSVEIDYRKSHEEQPKNRVIATYGIVYWNNKWYANAFCHLRNEIRSFRADIWEAVERKNIRVLT